MITEDLIHAIVWYASRRGEELTTLRLVKFIYLADLYHARCKNGETLTGCPWAFVYYGPWCKPVSEAIESVVRKGVVLPRELSSKYDDAKDYRVFRVEDTDEEPKLIDALPTYVWSKLQWAIQKWADDSFGLLDYVYFETEPMMEAKPGAILDFKRSQMPEIPKKLEMKKIPRDKVNAAKESIARLKSKFTSGIHSRPPQGPIDGAYQEFVAKLEEDDLETGLEGIAELGDLDQGPRH